MELKDPKQSGVKFTIYFIDPNLDDEDKEEEVQNLTVFLKELDEIERVNRVPNLNQIEGEKAAGSFLLGLLTAEVNSANAKKVMTFLGNRLSGKVIELEVEADGKKLKVKANSQAELEAAIESAKKFISEV